MNIYWTLWARYTWNTPHVEGNKMEIIYSPLSKNPLLLGKTIQVVSRNTDLGLQRTAAAQEREPSQLSSSTWRIDMEGSKGFLEKVTLEYILRGNWEFPRLFVYRLIEVWWRRITTFWPTPSIIAYSSKNTFLFWADSLAPNCLRSFL